jgi:hypothetical protein
VRRFQVLHDEELGKGDMKRIKEPPKTSEISGCGQEQAKREDFLELARIQGVSVNCVVDK